MQGPVKIDVREQTGECIAAIARQQIVRAPDLPFQNRRHFLQAGVSGQMAIDVVIFFEMVDVDHQQGQRRNESPATPPFGFKALIEAAAVGDSGQSVDESQRLQQIRLGLQGQVGIYPGADNRGVDRFGDKINRSRLQCPGFSFQVVLGGSRE